MAPTATSTSALRSREPVAERTMAFHFDRPAGFEFRAGQYMMVTLANPPETDAEGNTRTFTIASSPSDLDLMITTRMRDTAFKRVLRTVALPAEVKIAGPYGAFTLHKAPGEPGTLHKAPAKPAVFLAGGIGITPFFSISTQAARDKLPQQLYFFYSNRRPEDAAFLTALLDLAGQNPNFHFVPTMTEMEKSKMDWKGERGSINGEMLARHLPSLPGLKPGNLHNALRGSKEPLFHQGQGPIVHKAKEPLFHQQEPLLDRPIYYIAGPPAMVAAMRQMLAAAGADEDDMRTEEFSGY